MSDWIFVDLCNFFYSEYKHFTENNRAIHRITNYIRLKNFSQIYFQGKKNFLGPNIALIFNL